MSGPCAKMVVAFVIHGREGETVVGYNDCEEPQAVCPREPGEGYEKCALICRQAGHAEIQALRAARAIGMELDDTRGTLYGQDHVCDSCRCALFDAGLRFVSIRGKGSTPPAWAARPEAA